MRRGATSGEPRPVRWWPAAAICVLAVIALAAVRLDTGATGQERTFLSAGVLLLAVALLLAWVLLFSRLRWRVRLLVLALVALTAGAAAASLRVRGVTGDFMPVLAWRWDEDEPLPLPEPPAQVPAELSAGPVQVPVEGTASAAKTPGTVQVPATLPAGPAAEVPADEPPAAPRALEFPQFLGPSRNATLPGPRLATDWARPPREIWRRPVGHGWSGFAVAAGLAITQEQRGDEEAVAAYDLATGEPRWLHTAPGRYDSPIAGIGPRATPTVAGGRVYTMGAEGRLSALDLATGRRLWTRNVLGDTDAINPQWGTSCSPLVLDGRVIVSAGGDDGRSLAAYDAATGEPVWYGGTDRSGYGSPLLATLAGVPQVVIFNQASLAGHDPATGELLWTHPWSAAQPNVAQPLVLAADRLIASSGYGVGAELLAIERSPDGRLAPRQLWRSPRLKAKFSQMVLHGGHVYGLDDGVLACLDPATGERRWREGRYGHGQVLLVGDLLLVLTEGGEVALVRPDPEGLAELGRFRALDGKTWNTPALAGPYLLVRNDREAACFELPLAEEPKTGRGSARSGGR